MKRCKWCNLNNKLYIDYHDNEWGKPHYDDQYLYEMLILEMFQSGLSWECVLNKRTSFEDAYDNFNIEKVSLYDDYKINDLMNNSHIIRNRLKIKASVNNSLIFKNIVSEYGCFYNYLKTFTEGKIFIENNKNSNSLSDKISFDLKKRGMIFVGTKVIYAYLQATGVINSHDEECFLYQK